MEEEDVKSLTLTHKAVSYTYSVLEFNSSYNIFSIDATLNTYPGGDVGRCVIVFIGENLQAVLASNVVRLVNHCGCLQIDLDVYACKV